jgi:hypothetical protein
MTGDLSVKLGEGKKLEAYATNEIVESFGVTVAKVNDKFQIEELETFYDPSDMMRQLAKNRKDTSANPENDLVTPSGKCPFNPN